MGFPNVRAEAAAARAIATIEHIAALIQQGNIEQAAAAARVSWLTDPEFTVLPRSTVSELQMHVDSAWVALSSGDTGSAAQALRNARRLRP